MSHYSLSFNGSSGYVDAANASSFNGTGALTVMCWVKFLVAGTVGRLMSKWDGGGSWILESSFGNVFFWVNASGGTLNTAIFGQPADDAWHHVCGVYDGTDLRLYLDGTLASTPTAQTGTFNTGTNLIHIGVGDNEVAAFFNSKLTVPAILPVALSAGQVADIAAGILDPAALSPAAVWEFTEGAGTVAADTSGNGNDGALHAGVTWSSDVPPGLNGLAWDATSARGSNTSSASYTWSHACTGISRFLVVDVYIIDTGTPTVTGVTYNSVAMSFLGASSVSFLTTTLRVESWGLAAPATGTNTVAVTLSGAPANTTGFGVSYAGVDQPYPTEGAASANGVGTAASVSVTSVADNDWGHAAILTNDASPTEGEQSRAAVADTWGFAGAEDTDAPVSPPATTALTYTNASALSSWAMLGFAIRPLGAPAPTSAPASRNFFVFQAVNAAATY